MGWFIKLSVHNHTFQPLIVSYRRVNFVYYYGDVHQLDFRSLSKKTIFIQAIYTLQRLKTTFTPAEKLDVIVDVFNAITNEKGGSGAGRGFTWNMDVLLPVNIHFFIILLHKVVSFFVCSEGSH